MCSTNFVLVMHQDPPGPGTALLKSTTPEKSGSSASKWLMSGSLLGPSMPTLGSGKGSGSPETEIESSRTVIAAEVNNV